MFHSLYSPDKEAMRFAENLECPFNPEIIIIIEPGFSYCCKYLKNKFPDAKIGIVRLIEDFKDNNSYWDFIIKNETVESYLLRNFTEEKIIDTFLFTWNAASTVFNSSIPEIYNSWKSVVTTARTLLITRQYFEKKWVINACNFFKYLKKTAALHKINLPVVITASGPSLKNKLELLKENRNKFFLAGLSSSVPVLLKNNLVPDLVFTTDGGFWASKHIQKIPQDTVIACPQECCIPKKNLLKNPILPLTYSDGVTKDFHSILNLNSYPASRNPTVSGTALDFFKRITDKEIYLLGLDMNNTRGYSHTLPNYFETDSSSKDFRIKPLETRIINGSFASNQLELYRKWFEQAEDCSRIFRVIDTPLNTLGKIKDIKTINFNSQTKDKDFFEIKEYSSDIQKLYNHIQSICRNEQWKKQIFPADYVAVNHSNNEDSRKVLLEKLEEKNEMLIKKIRKILKNEQHLF